MKEAVLVYPHQLFEDNRLLQKERTVFLVEEPLFFTQYRFHKQKILLHRASMKAYQDMLTSLGYTVVYVEVSDCKDTSDIVSILKTYHDLSTDIE